MRPALFACALLVLAVLADAQTPRLSGWSQLQGGPGHAGVLPLPEGPIDVLASFQLLDQDATASAMEPGMVWTPRGLIGATAPPDIVGAGSCQVVLVDGPGPAVPVASWACSGSRSVDIVGYDAASDAILVCRTGGADSPILTAFGAADGDVRWAVGPVDAGVAPGMGPSVPGAPGEAAGTPWYCRAVLDNEGRVAYVAFGAVVDNRIAAVDIDSGAVLWGRTIQEDDIQSFSVPLARVDLAGSGAFAPAWPGLVPGGIVVPGLVHGAEPAVVWLDREGRVAGQALLGDVASVQSNLQSAPANAALSSQWPSAVGATAVAIVGPTALWIDVTANRAVRQATHGVAANGARPGAVWAQGLVALELVDRVIVYEGATASPVSSWESPGWFVTNMAATDGGDVLVVADSNRGGDVQVDLIRIDPLDGSEVHRVRLPINATFPSSPGLVPTVDGTGLIVWNSQGQAALLGRAPPDSAPGVTLSDAYPRPGGPADVTVSLPGPSLRGTLHWGDGAADALNGTATLSHRYGTEGPRTIRATAIYPDGRTATAEAVLDVGGTPPADLTAIQQAFSPQNQEKAFFALGLLITLVIALLSASRLRLRRSRLHRELGSIERAYADTRDRPLECEAALAERRAHVRGLLVDGKIDEAQYAILERRLDERASSLRLESIDEQFGFLSVSMARTLRDMLADGRIQRWERDHFIQALEQDTLLSPSQKERVRQRIEQWSERDAGGRA